MKIGMEGSWQSVRKVVVVSADGSRAGRAAVGWCAQHLGPGTVVVAVCGLRQSTGFSYGLEPGEMYRCLTAREEEFMNRWCDPLRRAGLRCDCRFRRCPQPVALREVCDTDIEATLRSWLEADAVVRVTVRHRRGTPLIQLADSGSKVTLELEPAPQQR